MIRINLLPEEYRKKSRTPIRMLVAITALVAVNAGLLAWWGWTVFGIQAKVDSERASLQLEMDGLAPQVTYYHSLETESKQYKSREKTLATITTDRISWTRKMDELIDVANAGGDGSRHLVWLDDLNVTQTTDATTKNYGSVRAAGHSGSDKFAQVANFLEDLETSAFIDDFERPAPPEGTQTLIDETLVPPIAWAFPMSLSLKSPEDRAKSEAARLAKNYKDPATENTDAGDDTDQVHPRSDRAKPENGAQPADGAKPTNGAKPANGTKPANGAKPANGGASPANPGKSPPTQDGGRKGTPEVAPLPSPGTQKKPGSSETSSGSAQESQSDSSAGNSTGKPGTEERR